VLHESWYPPHPTPPHPWIRQKTPMPCGLWRCCLLYITNCFEPDHLTCIWLSLTLSHLQAPSLTIYRGSSTLVVSTIRSMASGEGIACGAPNVSQPRDTSHAEASPCMINNTICTWADRWSNEFVLIMDSRPRLWSTQKDVWPVQINLVLYIQINPHSGNEGSL